MSLKIEFVSRYTIIPALFFAFPYVVEIYHTNNLLGIDCLMSKYFEVIYMHKERCRENMSEIRDYGGEPVAVNIHRLARSNSNFRTALWTGDNLQVTLMSIPVGGEIGIEMHPHTDQFLRIESGCADIMMGKCRENLTYRQKGNSDYSVMIPAGTWHNIKNIGNIPLKLYSVYAPPQHPFGTVHKTKADSDKAE